MGCFTASRGNFSRWSWFGFVSALLQSGMMTAQYLQSKSPSLAACLGLSVLFLGAYMVYKRKLKRDRGSPSPTTKYFLVAHLLVGTWYFWVSLITFLFHTAGFQVFQALFDGQDSPGDLSPSSRRLVIALFAVTVLSHLNEAYCIFFHTKRIGASSMLHNSGAAGGGLGGERPRYSAIYTVLSDCVLLVLTGLAYGLHKDHGAVALLLINLFSLYFQARYAWSAWRAPHVEDEWHTQSQLLGMQHLLIMATTFLVNLLMLLLYSVGISMTEIIKQDTGGEAASVLLSIFAYIGILISTVVLVGLHSLSETPAHRNEYSSVEDPPTASDYNGLGATPVALGATVVQLD